MDIEILKVDDISTISIDGVALKNVADYSLVLSSDAPPKITFTLQPNASVMSIKWSTS